MIEAVENHMPQVRRVLSIVSVHLHVYPCMCVLAHVTILQVRHVPL